MRRPTAKMRRRRYCPNHRTRVGHEKDPGQCSECGAAGVPFEVMREMRHERTAIRRGKLSVARAPAQIGRDLRQKRAIYDAYLETPQWRWIRKLVIARDGGCCLICFSKHRLHVHHLHYKTFTDETGEELATLCQPCHRQEHQRKWNKRLIRGPYAAVRTATAGAELDAEFAARLAREA